MAKNNKTKKTETVNQTKQKISFIIEMTCAIIFTLFTLNFKADISLLAFPISLIFTGITVYFTWFKFLKPKDSKKSFCVLKLSQYLPFVLLLSFVLRRAGKFGTPYWYDFISVILWCVIFITSFVISHQLNDKHIKSFTETWPEPKNNYTRPKGGFRVVFEIVDWIDALVQAVFIVLLFQIFVLQLYEIPSESMVPTFLIKDRVAVSKFDCGPKFPLTDVGLPDFRKYKKGDTIVLRNPHYRMDRKSEVKTVTSQLVYMLTFMKVNLNRDENGEIKYDPLVKRICGEPGEQLVMQDGILYSRTKNSDEFVPSTIDGKYATWDLTKIKSELLPSVQTYPFSQIPFAKDKSNYRDVLSSASENYNKMLEFEETRRNFDLNVAVFNANEIVRKFNNLVFTDNLEGDFLISTCSEFELLHNTLDITRRLMCQNGGKEWFASFMTSWISSKDEIKDMYEESNYKLNVMTKITFGKCVVRLAELLRNGADQLTIMTDPILLEEKNTIIMLDMYINVWLDSRNMPVFPANDLNNNPQYLPKNCYFMMGDNRFNSMDLRHSSGYALKKLTSKDVMSIEYESNMEPVYINKKYIIGKPVFRFWPTNRISRVR